MTMCTLAMGKLWMCMPADLSRHLVSEFGYQWYQSEFQFGAIPSSFATRFKALKFERMKWVFVLMKGLFMDYCNTWYRSSVVVGPTRTNNENQKYRF